jgi:hypothetical protein
MNGLQQIFDNLTEWRPLPGYSVERRLDLLLSPYLPRFLSAQMGAPVEVVAAEFPIPKRSAGGATDDNLHISADFLCLRRSDPPAWILVELKTDAGSRRGEQDRAYRLAAGREDAMGRLLKDLQAAKSSSKHWPGYSKLIWKVKRTDSRTQEVELCYIEPRPGGRTGRKRTEALDGGGSKLTTWSLGLGQLASAIDPQGDPLGALLQPFLRGLARSDKARGRRSASTPGPRRR